MICRWASLNLKQSLGMCMTDKLQSKLDITIIPSFTFLSL